MTGPPVVGVLALQGAFARHVAALERCGVVATEVRKASELDGLDALVIPGGESTTMMKLLDALEVTEPLAKLLADGLPVLGTCAGMILLATDIADGQPGQRCFGAVDIGVRRNGYGRQIDSFETDVVVDGVDGPPMRAVFIRAPVVERVGSEVEVLASLDGNPVVCRQGPALVVSFHPELTDDARLHRLFLDSLIPRSGRT